MRFMRKLGHKSKDCCLKEENKTRDIKDQGWKKSSEKAAVTIHKVKNEEFGWTYRDKTVNVVDPAIWIANTGPWFIQLQN
jgi:hypothetical protein